MEDFLYVVGLSELSLECEQKDGETYRSSHAVEDYCSLSVYYENPLDFGCSNLSKRMVDVFVDTEGNVLRAFACDRGDRHPIKLLPITFDDGDLEKDPVFH